MIRIAGNHVVGHTKYYTEKGEQRYIYEHTICSSILEQN